MLLLIVCKFFTLRRTRAAIRFSGMPHSPNPPSMMVAPSGMSRTASSAFATTLFIFLLLLWSKALSRILYLGLYCLGTRKSKLSYATQSKHVTIRCLERHSRREPHAERISGVYSPWQCCRPGSGRCDRCCIYRDCEFPGQKRHQSTHFCDRPKARFLLPRFGCPRRKDPVRDFSE